jgi:hypothetical protein
MRRGGPYANFIGRTPTAPNAFPVARGRQAIVGVPASSRSRAELEIEACWAAENGPQKPGPQAGQPAAYLTRLRCGRMMRGNECVGFRVLLLLSGRSFDR